MTRTKSTKFLVYVLIVILFSANQAAFASSMLHLHQQDTQTNSQTTTSSHHRDQVNSDQSTPVNGQDHTKHSECDGADHCNHCVNLLSSVISNATVFINLSPIPGSFASYYDITLPSDLRPPRHA